MPRAGNSFIWVVREGSFQQRFGVSEGLSHLLSGEQCSRQKKQQMKMGVLSELRAAWAGQLQCTGER